MAQDISQQMLERFQAQDTPALIEMVKKSKAGKDDAEMAALQHVLAARQARFPDSAEAWAPAVKPVDARPLASVREGVGNGTGVDGAVQGSVVATYLHGPALARNPELADWLLRQVVGDLAPIDDSEEEELRRERLASVRRGGATPRWWQRRRQWRPPAQGG